MVDARRTIRVSDLYARDVADLQAFHGVDVGRNVKYAPRGFNLDFLAVDPLEAANGNRGRFDHALSKLSWDLGGVHSDRPYQDIANALPGLPDSHPSDQLHIPEGPSAADVIKSAQEFRRAIDYLHVAAANAEQEALPHALLGNYALMAAWSQATSKPLEVSYKAVNGLVNLWVFASLPLRPGWVARNVVDNTMKSLIAGASDPRAYLAPFVPGTLRAARTVFEAGVGQAYEFAKFADTLFGTEVAPHFKVAMEHFWLHKTEQIERIFKMHGWNVPADVIEGARFNPFEQKVGRRFALAKSLDEAELERITDPELRAVAEAMVKRGQDGRLASFRDKVWHVMANVPENYAKKTIYNDTMAKLVADGLSPLDAHLQAWKKVEDTLFDYSKITVIEDNLRVFFPFIQFWRKNTGFWVRSVATKPWLTRRVRSTTSATATRPTPTGRLDAPLHQHAGGRRRRLVRPRPPVARRQHRAARRAVRPALLLVVQHLLPRLEVAQRQPRPRRAGPRLPRPVLDALDQWGVGLNPFIRKPLETPASPTRSPGRPSSRRPRSPPP
jgi:hypothetical protein